MSNKMLRYVLSFVFGLSSLLAVSACDNESTVDTLNDGEIYFFYQTTCPHCHDAAKYIKNKYPQLKMVSVDVRRGNNMDLFRQAVEKYHIEGSTGTPLITFEKDYIMGWSEGEKRRFDTLVQPYLRQ